MTGDERAERFNRAVARVCDGHPELHITCSAHGLVCLYWLEAEDEPAGCPLCRDEVAEEAAGPITTEEEPCSGVG